jgi:hypothetical protein
MNPPNHAPESRRDIIDFVEDLCDQSGNVAEVSPEYHEAFIALGDAEMETLVHAVLNAQAKEARRLTFAKPVAEAPARLLSFASNTISAIAIGLARFDCFALLGLYKRIGPEPEPDVHDALMEKIAKARPIIERIVQEFIRQQHEDAPQADSLFTKVSPATPIRHGWNTARDSDVESARIWQLQLNMFPPTPRDLCERMGLNWFAACQLHAGGWLSFDPRELATLNEAQEAELLLVGPLVAAGCDAELLARLLQGLRRPYQYRPGSIYLDWVAACWRLLPLDKEPDPQEVFAEWIESLKASEDRDQLEDIARDVAFALKSLPREEPDPD